MEEKITESAVVILNWNGEDLLRRFLPSVVEHTPHEVDIIVADNGSTDGSLELLRGSFAGRVSTIALDRNYGFAEGYNRALSRLNHKYFILLNSDVEVSAGWIEPILDRLINDDNIGAIAPKIRSAVDRELFDYAGAAGGMIDYFGYPYCRGRVMSCIERDRGQYDQSADIFWASGAAFGCRASLFRYLGGFDGDLFAHMEEIDLCWRMQLAGYRIIAEPRSVVYHLGGGTLDSGSAHKSYLNHRNNLIMLHKCASTTQLAVVMVARPLLDLLTALLYMVGGRADRSLSVIKAWIDHIKMLPATHRKRRSIRSSATASVQTIYRGSIFWLARHCPKG